MKTSRMLDSVWENCQQVKEDDRPLSLGRTHPECCAQCWAAQCKSDMAMLERVQRQATTMVKRLEHL